MHSLTSPGRPMWHEHGATVMPIDALDAAILVALFAAEPRIGVLEARGGSASPAAPCRPGWTG